MIARSSITANVQGLANLGSNCNFAKPMLACVYAGRQIVIIKKKEKEKMKSPEDFYKEFYPEVCSLSVIDEEIVLLLSVYKKRILDNSFAYIVETWEGKAVSYHVSLESAKNEIKRVQGRYKKNLLVNCQKLY
jgi:hypothetical protein